MHLLPSLVLLFSPLQMTVGKRGNPLPKPQAQKIAASYYEKIRNAKSAYILEESSTTYTWFKSEGWLMKPNLYRNVSQSGDRKRRMTYRTYMAGQTSYSINDQKKTYDLFDHREDGPEVHGLEPFTYAKQPEYIKLARVFEATVNGKPALAIRTIEQSLPDSRIYVYFDKTKLLPIAWEYSISGKPGEMHSYKQVKLDVATDKKDFAWTPPAGYKLGQDFRKVALYGRTDPELASILKGKQPPHPAVSKASQSKAMQILKAMQQVYAKCKSYKDEGDAVTVFMVGNEVSTDRQPFKTLFKRPGQLRFEFSSEHMGRKSTFLLCSNGKLVKNTLRDGKVKAAQVYAADTYASYQTERNEEIGLAIAGFVGISMGVAANAPAMLLPDQIYTASFQEQMPDLQYEAEEKLGSLTCDRLYSRKRNTTLWIDKATRLLIKSLEIDGSGADKSVQRTSYRPALNVAIPDTSFKFNPPK